MDLSCCSVVQTNSLVVREQCSSQNFESKGGLVYTIIMQMTHPLGYHVIHVQRENP